MAFFTTARIQQMRQRSLDASETKALDNIEKHSCHIIHVDADAHTNGWSYTIGLTELFQKPELMVTGLSSEVAHFLLNEYARRLQSGQELADGARVQGFLEAVNCEFRLVDRKWIRPTMGWAVWFYGGDHFPVLQCVYPDLQNKFPWEDGFDSTWRKRQPLLFIHSLPNDVEEDFWAANDPKSNLFRWRFSDHPHTGVYTTKRVMSGDDRVTRVFHDADDGAWQFHGPGDSEREHGVLVCFHHVVDKDESIAELADLPLGWCAWREDEASPWIREEQSDTVEEES